jgi:(1->4)-alpha-D-glucan 1-alpha-D-glucosylmutase
MQLNPGFDFDAAAELAPYLRRLGVSHLYSSPWLQAAPGSSHGYDVVDHGKVSDELGGPAAHARLHDALDRAQLGVVLDIVPNHMAVDGKANAWWWDVLEDGPASVYAGYFDVDWDPPDSKLRNRVLLPFLPDHYGRVLEAGQFTLRRDGGALVVAFADHQMPIAPHSLGAILAAAVRRLGAGSPRRSTAETLVADFDRLPAPWLLDEQSVQQRHRSKMELRARLAELCAGDRTVADALDAEVAATSSDPDRLDTLLEAQNYRLAWWRTGADELDYRRFFDISSLVALRQEDARVFNESHQLVLDWVRRGVVDGLRVDHVDGLRDPKGYLDRLACEAPGVWVVVEKIVAVGERLPGDWPVAGTTGYDWLNVAGGLFVDPAGEDPLTKTYVAFTGQTAPIDEVAHDARIEVLRGPLATDLRRLTSTLVTVCEANRRYRDYARRELRQALEAILACFPVYRTYVRPDAASDADRDVISSAMTAVRSRHEDVDVDLLEFIRSILVLDTPGDAETELALRFQQLSSAVMAKGVEDTAFYRYLRLVSLNEVGGDPGRFGTPTDAFHRFACRAQIERPLSLLGTSTHDTKRGEDVRARLAVLSEIPDAWAIATGRWASIAERHRSQGWPDANMEWLWYQTLVGAWPLSLERARRYMEKASKEAKQHTSWESPDATYDAALGTFLEGFVTDRKLMRSVKAFVASIVRPGWTNALAQKLLTLTAPGVPDIYQGTELWDLSLVDPDNRQAVDFATRRRLLDALDARDWEAALPTGSPKMLVVARALGLRSEHPEWFGEGEAGRYEPVEATGPQAEHVVAFARGGRSITVVPRLTVGLARAGGWGTTALPLPPGSWLNRLTGAAVSGRVLLDDLLASFPVALLTKVS